jgi:hypothetical protein
MREVTAIDPKWLTEAAPTFFRIADANKISKRKKQEKIEVRYKYYLGEILPFIYILTCVF